MAIDWAKNIGRLNAKEGNEPEGDDWFTAKEFIENSNFGSGKSRAQLKRAVADGDIEVHRGSRWASEFDHLVRCTWYRFVNRK